MVGDWDGNGTTTIGVVDPATMTWYLRKALHRRPEPHAVSVRRPRLDPRCRRLDWRRPEHDWGGGSSERDLVFADQNSSGGPDIAPFATASPGGVPWSGMDGNGTTTIGVVDPTETWYVRNQNGGAAR